MSNPNGANVNIAINQGGDEFVLGSLTPVKTVHNWQDLRRALALASPDYIAFFDDFIGDVLSDEWDEDISTGATVAINAQAGGVVRLTTDTDDNDHATLALGLHWTAGVALYFEARVKSVTDTLVRAVEVGVSDALLETNGIAFSSHDATPVDVATDAAVFGWNTDESMTAFSALSVKAGGTPQYTDTGVALATTYTKLGILIDTDGTAYFYANDVLVATHSAAIATTAVLTPWITLKSLSGAAKSIDVDYVLIIGER